MKQYKTIWVDGKQKRLHRHLVEESIGRSLSFNEVVHHKDGDIFNNNLDNLELLTRAEHMNRHSEIKLASINAKKKYDPDIDKIREMYVKEHHTAKDISESMGIPVYTINWIIRKYGMKHKNKKCKECGNEIGSGSSCNLCPKCYRKKYYRKRKGTHEI